MKPKYILLLIAMLVLNACWLSYSPDVPVQRPPSPAPAYPPTPKPVDDSSVPIEDRFCTEIYDPVCAKIQIQCITTPCDPIWETFTNRCYAEKAGGLQFKKGECVVD